MEIGIAIENELNNKNEQNKFLDTTLGKAIDNGIEIGLRYVLPNYIEDEVIQLKDNLLNYGLKDGISKSIQSVIDTGKSAIGILTGNFSNIAQIKGAIKAGGLIDSISDLLDDIFDKVRDSGKVNKSIVNLAQNGKDSILGNIEKNIEKTLNEQLEGIENLDEHIKNWKNDYNNQDFKAMEKEFKMIKTEIKNLVPIENTLNNARNIEILHNLIKNNNGEFNLSKEEMELAEKLSVTK